MLDQTPFEQKYYETIKNLVHKLIGSSEDPGTGRIQTGTFAPEKMKMRLNLVYEIFCKVFIHIENLLDLEDRFILQSSQRSTGNTVLHITTPDDQTQVDHVPELVSSKAFLSTVEAFRLPLAQLDRKLDEPLDKFVYQPKLFLPGQPSRDPMTPFWASFLSQANEFTEHKTLQAIVTKSNIRVEGTEDCKLLVTTIEGKPSSWTLDFGFKAKLKPAGTVPPGSPEDRYLNHGRNICESATLISVFYLGAYEEIYQIKLPKAEASTSDLDKLLNELDLSNGFESMKSSRKRLTYPPKASVFAVLDVPKATTAHKTDSTAAAVVVAAHKQHLYYSKIPTAGRIFNSSLKLQTAAVVDAVHIFGNTIYACTSEALYLLSFKNHCLKHFRSFSLECIGNPCVRLVSPPVFIHDIKVMAVVTEPANEIHGLAFFEDSVVSIPGYTTSLLTVDLSLIELQ